MKRYFAIILALIFAVSLIACNNNDQSESSDISDEYYFTAKVIEANDTSILLEVTNQGHSGLSAGALASIALKQSYPECEEGDLVRVEFDGVIQETYPCQLPNVYSISKTDK